MSDYAIALFLHIVGAFGFFAALGLEWTGLRQIQSAIVPEQVRAWMPVLKNTRKIGFVSMLTTVISGLYMVVTIWGTAPWVMVPIGALVLIIVLSLVLTGPRMAAIGQAMPAEKGRLSQTFHSLANHPLLRISIQIRVAITLGIVLLKIAKPDWGESLLTIGVAILLGLVSALPMPRRERAQEGSVN